MKRVFKYPLIEAKPNQVVIEAPLGAEILSVGLDPDGKAVVWAVVHPEVPPVRQPLALIGTGDEVPDDIGDFIGTVVSGALVGHLFWVNT